MQLPTHHIDLRALDLDALVSIAYESDSDQAEEAYEEIEWRRIYAPEKCS